SQQGERTKRGLDMQNLPIVQGGAVIMKDGQIEWIGRSSDLPAVQPTATIIDATNKTVLPGLIDSHTHLIFTGSREDEFEDRLQGLSYQEITARGGGIHATVRRVREAAADQLKEPARRRLPCLLRFGVTT